MARHEFKRSFYALRDLCARDMVLDLPWLDDEQAYLQSITTRVFALMDGTSMEIQTTDKRVECLLMPLNQARFRSAKQRT
jgi:hypothetical protein